jgi:hypothetical protein
VFMETGCSLHKHRCVGRYVSRFKGPPSACLRFVTRMAGERVTLRSAAALFTLRIRRNSHFLVDLPCVHHGFDVIPHLVM